MLPGLVGLLQASETLKLLLGIGDSLVGRLLHLDALRMEFRELKLRTDPGCVVCGDQPSVTEPIDYASFCGAPCSPHSSMKEITPQQARERLDCPDDPAILLDVREPDEREAASIQGSLFIPLGEVEQRHAEIPRDRELLVHCKLGGRSAQAVAILQEKGWERICNVEGGIMAWADTVDPSLKPE